MKQDTLNILESHRAESYIILDYFQASTPNMNGIIDQPFIFLMHFSVLVLNNFLKFSLSQVF